MGTAKINRAALGSTASLGDLYDARRDDFCGISFFKSAIPDSAVTIQDANFSDIKLVHNDNFSDKAAKLDVSAELQVSVLAGLFKLKGSGHYLGDQKQSARTVKSSLVYNIKTKDEYLNLFHGDLRESFALDAVKIGLATHVVVGISWGANSILSCFYENKENRDVREIEGNLSAQMKTAILSISGAASVQLNERDNSSGVTFEIHVYGDVLSSNQLPTTFETALEFMTQVPTLVKNSNNGKGKPLMYHLLPVSLLKDYLNFSVGAGVLVKSIEETSLARVVQMFELMSTAQQKLNDFYQDTMTHSYCVKRADLKAITTLKNEMTIQETSARSQLSHVLQKIRSGKGDVEHLERFLHNYQSCSWSLESIDEKMVEWSEVKEKIQLAQALQQHGAKYIGHGNSLEELILQDFDATCYVLYFTQNAKKEDSQRWKGNRQIFFQEMKKQSPGHKYFVVDCDIHPDLKIEDRLSCVQTMKSGMVTVEDLLVEQQETVPVAKVNLVSGTTVRSLFRPNRRVPLVLPCTGRNCSPTAEYEWTCNKCQALIDYGFDDHVYCVCGKTPALGMEFKCTDPKHGVTYEQHEESFLTQLLLKLRPFDEMNILIMGETGAGKSTWINGFMNYLTYETLEEAEAGQLVTLIPSQFTVSNEDYEEVTVSTGVDDNEVVHTGQSTTQKAKVYAFPLGKTTVRLIDTPGIGDNREIEQDKVTFEDVLGSLSHLEEIHGICILLKPNSAQLIDKFRYCIMQQLTQLHPEAKQTIVFCFTHTRGALHRPGDAMPALKKLLADKREVDIPISRNIVYCYDNEAYRFLATVKNHSSVTFSTDERLNFSRSWHKSREETKRMMLHFQTNQPHVASNTVKLSQVQILILRLVEPLVEINRKIQEKTQTMEEEQRVIAAGEEELNILRGKQVVSRTEIEVRPLAYPYYKCANGQHCNPVPSGLGRLRCMNCGIFQHLHAYISEEPVEVVKEIVDPSVTLLLQEKLSSQETKRQTLEANKKELEEYKTELGQITQVSSQLANFIKRNGVTAYNDAVEEYMNNLIRKTESAESSPGNPGILDNLRSNWSNVRKNGLLEQFLNDNLTRSEAEPPEPSDINRLIEELEGLKHSGIAITEVWNTVKNMFNNVYRETVVAPPKKEGSLYRVMSHIS